ncbi:Alpha/beta hydrolase fold-1 [uncultured Caudovirales phage]|uniref:Alpha/beta hydrolase fold-1 n=1 Tax=uncultured Caudovirales phage TaxID=2100421 RepID=A0A6J5LY22_9CAUD|nr:Alpha/beta hydrolase fold-1 [uncultured Caudovirales phage]
MLFVNPVPGHHKKLLYIMGATWHTRCMFDLDTHDASFAQLLNQQGIETYAPDIVGTGPGRKSHVIGNCYHETLEYLDYIVTKFDIDHVMGYSTGCAFAVDLAKKHNFKKIVLLDPQSKSRVDRQLVDNDKYTITKQSVRQALIENLTSVDSQTTQDHLDALCPGDTLTTAAWPMLGRYLTVFDSQQYVDNLVNNYQVKTFFTKQSTEQVRQRFGCHGTYWPHISHWVLLEPYRKELANEIVEFLKHE